MAETIQFLIVFVLGGILGVGWMALMKASAKTNREITRYRLFIALNNLYVACMQADMEGDLSGYVTGEYLEEAQTTLELFNREG